MRVPLQHGNDLVVYAGYFILSKEKKNLQVNILLALAFLKLLVNLALVFVKHFDGYRLFYLS